MTDIVCIQNFYNVAKRDDDKFLEKFAAKGIAYAPYFPLGGFEPLQLESLDRLAEKAKITPMQLALAWLLQRSPNILLTPGTGSLGHLRENIRATSIDVPTEIFGKLDQLGEISVS
jgi:pyridoxine 4-dehydrogenase